MGIRTSVLGHKFRKKFLSGFKKVFYSIIFTILLYFHRRKKEKPRKIFESTYFKISPSKIFCTSLILRISPKLLNRFTPNFHGLWILTNLIDSYMIFLNREINFLDIENPYIRTPAQKSENYSKAPGNFSFLIKHLKNKVLKTWWNSQTKTINR